MGVLHKRAAWPVARPSDQAHALYRAPLCVWKQAPPQGDKARLSGSHGCTSTPMPMRHRRSMLRSAAGFVLALLAPWPMDVASRR